MWTSYQRLSLWTLTVTLCGGLLTIPDLVMGQDADLKPDLLAPIDGPAPPIPPSVLSRDENGRATGRAVRLTSPLRIDGQLDEAVYTTVPAMSDFVQTEPLEGTAATEKTEVWIFFDDEHVYLMARCWESEPDRIMVDEMRRDNRNIGRNDNLAWMFDTLYDQRTGVVFEVNPLGGRMDGQTSNAS